MKKFVPYILLSPMIVIFILTKAVPAGLLVRLSLFKTNYITETFIGLRNFVKIFTDPSIAYALKNSVLYAVIIVPVYMLIGLFLGFLAHDMNKKVQHVARFFFMISTFVSGIVIASSWKWIFHPRDGLVNWLLSLGGIEPVRWWSSTLTSVPAISFIHLITYTGSTAIVFIAALHGIDSQILEAAKIDGARRGQIRRLIQMPLIAPTIALFSLLAMIGTFHIFEWIYMLAPYDYASTIMYRIYHDGFVYGRPGLAAAESLVLLCIILVLTVAQKRLQKWRF